VIIETTEAELDRRVLLAAPRTILRACLTTST
jgi:hypothetical protein